MISSSLLTFCVLAYTGFVASAPSPDMYIPPAPHGGVSPWVAIRTDETAWQAACGHQKHVGAVCLDGELGKRDLFRVQTTAQQNVVFSGGGHYFNAYCPNLDKGEKPYSIQYGGDDALVYMRILGRKGSQSCCPTQYINTKHQEGTIQCIHPSVISAASFPPNDMIDSV